MSDVIAVRGGRLGSWRARLGLLLFVAILGLGVAHVGMQLLGDLAPLLIVLGVAAQYAALAGYRPELRSTPEARATVAYLLLHPPLPLAAPSP